VERPAVEAFGVLSSDMSGPSLVKTHLHRDNTATNSQWKKCCHKSVCEKPNSSGIVRELRFSVFHCILDPALGKKCLELRSAVWGGRDSNQSFMISSIA